MAITPTPRSAGRATRSSTSREAGRKEAAGQRTANGPATSSPRFAGFPTAALDFYDDLEADNSKTFWEARKDTYLSAVREPMIALTDALGSEFGPATVFRPYRDVRFARDKTAYKTHQGAFVAVAPATGWYVEISAPGVRVAGGFYRASSAGIAAVRTAMVGPGGAALQKIVAKLRRAGWEIGGERLKTTPRGYDSDDPRIELLRHKSLTASRTYGFDEMIHTADLLDRVRKDWRAVRALVEWLAPRLEGTADAR